MSYCLLILIALCARGLGRFIDDRLPFVWSLLLGYGVFVATALPLALIDYWTPAVHSIVLAGPAIWFTNRNRNFSLPQFEPSDYLCLGIFGLGVAFQWEPIYHLYATHDPSAYLNSALHLFRTGHFVHHNPLVAMAYSGNHGDLIPFLNVGSSAQEWQLTRNFGVIPSDLASGSGTFHGLIAAPLFLAFGIGLFGVENALCTNWVHLLTSLLLIREILRCWLPEEKRERWVALGLLLFVICPLTAPIFREPLSEPLAQVFFLGMVLCLLRRDVRLAPLAFVACAVGAIVTRVSGMLYLPFLFAPVFGRRYALATAGATSFGLLIVARTSPTYVKEILTFYAQKVPGIEVPLLLLSAIAVFSSVKYLIPLLEKPRIWKSLWVAFGIAFTVGVIFRYARLVIHLDHNLGGYPFVLFNLDSLLFYGGPLVVIVGLGEWLRRLYVSPVRQFFFIQAYLPFCLFFYGVFRFIPLNLQVNFQRYLVIELVPLAIIGMVLAIRRWSGPKWRTAGITFSLAWSAILLFSINHFGMCANTYRSYANLIDHIGSHERTAIVAVEASWRETATLLPLDSGFGIPVLFVDKSEKIPEAAAAVRAAGYRPLFAATKPQSDLDYQFFWQDCYRYPRFGLGAPPLELETHCVNFSFYEDTAVKALSFHRP